MHGKEKIKTEEYNNKGEIYFMFFFAEKIHFVIVPEHFGKIV